MVIEEFIQSLLDDPQYKNQIIFKTEIAATPAQYGSLDFNLEPELTSWIKEKNLRLYSHQARALNSINRGKNIVITTPTASGKTLIFSLAVANSIVRRRNTSALFLYPTKALANDQLKKLEDLNEHLQGKLRPFIYDGDTPTEIRPGIRNSARVIISNPYALHQYLDWHDKWARFYRNLRYIVIDEAHTYRGVFGSNVAQLLRRLCRILEYYGVSPQFILSSATINNPESFATKLINYPVTVIDNDGAEYGSKHLLLWNPPFIDKFELKRRSPHQETRDLLVKHLQNNLQTLTFTLSRKMAELISLWVKNDLDNIGINQNQIMTYRAGYRPLERREIEKKLRVRELQGVVSTNALEVGIDLGELDAVILSGFPGTIISTKQQMGRVGRSHQSSLATLVLFEDALQQFLGKNPDYFLTKNPENAIIDLENPYILKGHILCASAELPLKLEEIDRIWGTKGKIIASELRKEGLLKFLPSGLSSISSKRPASIINLNSAFSSLIEVRIRNKLLETLTLPQAYREAHEGAILIHQGEKYFIEQLNLEKRTAIASPVDIDYYTEVLSTSEVTILESIKSKSVGFQLFWGKVKATEFYHSFRKKTYDEVIETIPLDLPTLEYETKAVWIEIPDELVSECQEKLLDFGGGIHAFEHATIALSPIYAMCDRWDIGGVSYTSFPSDGKSKIFIYDGYPGGIGISEKIFEKWPEITSNVLKLIQECECADGCPSCVQSPKCGNDNFPLSKKVAILLLENMLALYREEF